MPLALSLLSAQPSQIIEDTILSWIKMGILDKIANALGNGPKTFHVLVIGLDNSGKSTMINFLKPENLRISGEIPPTVGVQMEKVKFKNSILNFHDMSGQGKYRAMWERCFTDCNAIVFVIDSCDRMRLAVAKDEFEGVVQHAVMKDRNIPYMIVLNKKDQPNTIPVASISQVLDLDRQLKNRAWQLQPSNSLNGEGLVEGFTWLTEMLVNAANNSRNQD